MAQEETHAPAEKVTPGMHVRQLALPVPLHVRHVSLFLPWNLKKEGAITDTKAG